MIKLSIREAMGLPLAMLGCLAATPSDAMTITIDRQGTCTVNGSPADREADEGGAVEAVTYTASSNYQNYTGFSGEAAGMRDGNYSLASSIHGTNNEPHPWIMMDLGTVREISKLIVAPADTGAPGGWGHPYLDGATLERSTNRQSWQAVSIISSSVDGVPVKVDIGAPARYFRIRKESGWLGVGDFYATVTEAPAATEGQHRRTRKERTMTATLTGTSFGTVQCIVTGSSE